ncbi:uncharacterized protein LOC119287746 isoform X2 [Triticum dicoccoides]|uniref:uncharacterized protein LOC119287746 isoform X2 n=1 Tax=Triticum dicoccoides TaxID=85692 RepID=UPI00188F8FF5|nr:uncharacterized protein LOC119287746 isoform X2 [Triticum dicoccoides]
MERGSCRCRAPTVLRQGKGTHAGDGVPPRATGEWRSWSPATVELQAARGKAATGKRRSWNRPEKELETFDFFAGRKRHFGLLLSMHHDERQSFISAMGTREKLRQLREKATTSVFLLSPMSGFLSLGRTTCGGGRPSPAARDEASGRDSTASVRGSAATRGDGRAREGGCFEFNEEARTLRLKKYKTIIHPGES